MPRNGSGVYTLSAGYLAVNGATATAAQHNGPLEDLETDMNTARPIVAGGTGAGDAATARTNLGVDDLVDGTTVISPEIDSDSRLVDAADNTKEVAFVVSGVTTATTRSWTFPDFDGTFVGVDATQTLTNKSFSDSTTSIVDNADNTKVFQIEASGITTGTTRTWTVPDSDDTFAGIDAVQTFTNKSFSDSSTAFADHADLTKRVKFELGGLTTSTTRIMTVPDASITLGGGLANIQTFTSSGTYTPSTGVRQAIVRLVGAGGGGGGADSDGSGQVGSGAGGGAGGFVEGFLDVSGGAYTSTITIGAAGAAGTHTTDGGDGGDTVYADGTVTWTAAGGGGGNFTSDETNRYVKRGGAGGTSTAAGATFSYRGAAGGEAHGNPSATQPIATGGYGASSSFGGGGRQGGVQAEGNNDAGSAATGYGAGGGGAAAAGTIAAAAGGAGTAGFVIVYEYY